MYEAFTSSFFFPDSHGMLLVMILRAVTIPYFSTMLHSAIHMQKSKSKRCLCTLIQCPMCCCIGASYAYNSVIAGFCRKWIWNICCSLGIVIHLTFNGQLWSHDHRKETLNKFSNFNLQVNTTWEQKSTNPFELPYSSKLESDYEVIPIS